MKVGIDFDGTISVDYVAFRGVVHSFLDAGHDVAIVTWRVPPEESSQCNGSWDDIEEFFQFLGHKIPVVYCSGKAKRDCYPANIWIEDNPGAVLFSLTRAPRFEADPRNYKKDLLILEKEGYEPITVEWSQLRTL